MENNKIYNVKNRSSSMVVYSIPEMGVRREFSPGETKKISYHELEQLSYRSGGRTLMEDYLFISNDEAIADLGLKTEQEYYMNEQQVLDLIQNGSYDEWLDALDFAPAGVIDLIKKFSVELPLNDIRKGEALKNKTGYDVQAAINNLRAEQAEMQAQKSEAIPERRVKKEEPTTTTSSNRRTTGSKYKVISQEN